MNRSNASTHPDYLTREEALRRLQVKPQTLYAYVSRGYIRSLPAQAAGPTPRRGSVYSRDDVDKMRARSLARAGHVARHQFAVDVIGIKSPQGTQGDAPGRPTSQPRRCICQGCPYTT
jgi:hypothetical protein